MNHNAQSSACLVIDFFTGSQAGTQTPLQGDLAVPATTQTLVVMMGPRLRRDDNGWPRAKDA
jgi:hypothetical protein